MDFNKDYNHQEVSSEQVNEDLDIFIQNSIIDEQIASNANHSIVVRLFNLKLSHYKVLIRHNIKIILELYDANIDRIEHQFEVNNKPEISFYSSSSKIRDICVSGGFSNIVFRAHCSDLKVSGNSENLQSLSLGIKNNSIHFVANRFSNTIIKINDSNLITGEIRKVQSISFLNNICISSGFSIVEVDSLRFNGNITGSFLHQGILPKTCNSVEFINCLIDASMSFENLLLRRFIIKNSHIKSDNSVTFNNIHFQKHAEFILSSSSLGEVKFTSIDFTSKKLKQFKVENCDFENIKPANVTWPKQLTINQNFTEIQEQNDYETNRKRDLALDYFRQLKVIYKKKEDILNFQLFKSLEFNELLKVPNKTFGNKLSVPDELSLWLGKVTSKHGTDWWLAFKLLLGVNFVFWPIVINLYLFISLEIGFPIQSFLSNILFPGLIDPIFYSSEVISNKYNADNLFSYKDSLTFLNPAHSFNDISLGMKDNVLLTFDTLAKVFNGYLYFQIVKSFRKFVS